MKNWKGAVLKVEQLMIKDYGNWYKGNLHSHTTSSDGHLTPQESAQLYYNHGYSFICFSEHDKYTDLRQELDRDDFITLPGVEASAMLFDQKLMEELSGYSLMEIIQNEELRKKAYGKFLKTHHIHGILGNEKMQKEAQGNLLQNNETLLPPIYGGDWNGKEAAQQLSDSLKKRGMFTTYNHPIWSRVDMEDILGLEGIWAMELYNYDTVNECGEGSNVPIWDLCLKKNMKLQGFASDDNHNNGKFTDSCGGYVVVNAPELTHEAIVNGLMEGNYYSSNMGPAIRQWGIKEQSVFVECEGCERINFICGGPIGSSETVMAVERQPLFGARHLLRGSETYIRIECVDANGHTSWTNPYFF